MDHGHKMARPVTSREEYLRLRNSSEQLQALTRARQGDSQGKRRLAQFNYSLASDTSFALKGADRPGNSVGMDIDMGPDDWARECQDHAIRDHILSLKDRLGLLMLERSASKGYHLAYRRHREMDNEQNLRWASDLIGVEYDRGAKDLTRVLYATSASPDDLVYLDDALFAPTLDAAPPAPVGATDGAAAHTAPGKDAPDTDAKAPSPATEQDADVEEPSYLGIPYSAIIDRYWQLYYGGHTPVKSNRDTLTYELANVMKHICAFDRDMLDRVIPRYDGFGEQEKLKCIDSALSGKRTQMPRRLREVLESLRSDKMMGDRAAVTTERLKDWEEAFKEDELFVYRQLPREVLVADIKDTVDSAGHRLAMPALLCASPVIGARASGVRLLIHGRPSRLNLMTFCVGDAASGKGQMDDIVMAWAKEDILMADTYNRQWSEWRDRMRAAKNKKEQPQEPHFPKVWIPLNNTTANLAEELANVDGRHAISFTPEADVVVAKWKSGIVDFSTMVRQAYDGSSYDREARSVDSVNVHIKQLLWNIVMCGTPDALYRVVNNYTDGLQTRIAVAHTPDNTWTRLDDHPASLTDLQREHIYQVSHLLPLLSGTLDLPRLEEEGRRWLDQVIIESSMNDDRTMARQRYRICVTTQRVVCCLMLVALCAKLVSKHGTSGAEQRLKEDPELWIKMAGKQQTPQMLSLFPLIADYLMDSALYYFRQRIEAAYASPAYSLSSGMHGMRVNRGKNDSIYARLPLEFGYDEAASNAIAVKGHGITTNVVRMMLRNWQRQSLIERTERGTFRKCCG